MQNPSNVYGHCNILIAIYVCSMVVKSVFNIVSVISKLSLSRQPVLLVPLTWHQQVSGNTNPTTLGARKPLLPLFKVIGITCSGIGTCFGNNNDSTNVSYVTLYQACSNYSDPLKNMTARCWGLLSLYVYVYIILTIILIKRTKPILKEIDTFVHRVIFYWNWSIYFDLLINMATSG